MSEKLDPARLGAESAIIGSAFTPAEGASDSLVGAAADRTVLGPAEFPPATALGLSSISMKRAPELAAGVESACALKVELYPPDDFPTAAAAPLAAAARAAALIAAGSGAGVSAFAASESALDAGDTNFLATAFRVAVSNLMLETSLLVLVSSAVFLPLSLQLSRSSSSSRVV